MQGMPRRYYDYLPEFATLNLVSTVGCWILVVGPGAACWSTCSAACCTGSPVGGNPWGGATLEWSIPTPPPTENFAEEPVVTHGPYDFKGTRRSHEPRVQHKDYAGAKARHVAVPVHRTAAVRRAVPPLRGLPRTATRRSLPPAGSELNWFMGAANTVILLTSSLLGRHGGHRPAARRAATGRAAGRRDDPLRRRLPGHQVLRVERQDRPRHLSRLASTCRPGRRGNRSSSASTS